MKIISKFKDYYDIGLAYGTDPKCVYKRETIKVEWEGVQPSGGKFLRSGDVKDNPGWFKKLLSHEVFTHSGKTLPRNIWVGPDEARKSEVRILLFCGKAYLSIEAYDRSKQRWCRFWSAESLRSADLETEVDQPGRYRYLSRGPEYTDKLFQIGEYFTRDFVDSILREAGSPIVELRGDSRYHDVWAIVNPNLSRIGFQSVVDPYTAFQEVSMYLTNVIGIPENPMVEVDNDSKVAKHGYNKQSFRHPVK